MPYAPRATTVGGSIAGAGVAGPPPAAAETLPIGEQLMHVDQAITLTLQEIDANFARAHQCVTGRILPAVKHYGVASARTWQGARFWKHFFEVSANVSLTTPVGDAEAEAAAAGEASALGTSTYDVDTSRDYADESGAGATPRAATRTAGAKTGDAGAGDETSQLEDIGDDSDDLDHSGFFQSLRHAKASSPAARGNAARQGGADDTAASWAPVESPFERLKKDVESQLGSRGDVTESSAILESHRAQRERAMRGETEQVRRGIAALHTGSEGSSSLAEPPKVSARPSGAAAPDAARRTPKKSTPLLRKVLANEQRRASPGGAIPRVTATPRGAAKRGNPFGPSSARAQASSPAMEPPMSVRRWDGIADLRKTPLASARKIRNKAAGPSKGDKEQKGAKPDEWDDSDSDDEASLAWPAGMSPPVTMRFSVPQSRYHKTPAKEAARLVVDDLLRTVGAGSPAQFDLGVAPSVTQTATARGARPSLVGTPLRKGPVAKARGSHANKRRDSLPTPPTLTRSHQPPPGAGASSTTPSAPPRAGSNVPGSASTAGGSAGKGKPSSAARLMDEDEGLEDDDVPQDLGTGLSRVALQKTPAEMDALLAVQDDDSESDDSSSDDEDDDDAGVGSALGSSARGEASGAYSISQGWTASSISSAASASASGASSRARTIDQDTLFGIRPPAPRAPAAPAPAAASGTAAGAGKDGFRPWGHVDEMGTVHGGRPLLDERDNTYSAPSPTPATRE